MKCQEKDNARLISLDALRGFDMLFIMGLAEIIVAIANLFPNSSTMIWLGKQMNHVEWNGLSHHDTIFPLFLFIAGISFPFSLYKQRSLGKSDRDIYFKIVKRGIILVILGFVYNGLFKLDFEHMRYASVLARVGLAWMFAALLFMKFNTKTNIIFAAVILIGYWLLLWMIPNSVTPFSFEHNLVGTIDRMLLPGKLAFGSFDPEGVLSALPAIAMALLGMFTGELVQLPDEQLPQKKKVTYMIVAAIALIAIGLLWDRVFPINKKLWTSSFVCVVSGYSLLSFVLFYYILDVKRYTRYSLFLRVVGLNSITIYLAQGIIDFKGIKDFFLGGVINYSSQNIGTLIGNIGYFAACWLFLYFLYKKKVFIKV